MRRSEMIELMARTLEKNFDFYNGNWTDDAEKLLDQMEYVGMKPPEYMEKGCLCGSCYVFYEWESE